MKDVYVKNAITKDLDRLLRKIDSRVRWADFIPRSCLSTHQDLVAIGFKDGTTRYIDVTEDDAFSMVKSVCNTLDDFAVEKQFLTPRRLEPIRDDIRNMAKRKQEFTAEAIATLSSHMMGSYLIRDEDCLLLYQNAQKMGVVPKSYPNNSVTKWNARQTIANHLQSDASSITDTEWFYQEIQKSREAALSLDKKLPGTAEFFGRVGGRDSRNCVTGTYRCIQRRNCCGRAHI